MLLLLTSMSLYCNCMYACLYRCVHIYNTCHITITAVPIISLLFKTSPTSVTTHPLHCLEHRPIFCRENHVVSEYQTAPIPTLSQNSSSAFKGNISIYVKINHQKKHKQRNTEAHQKTKVANNNNKKHITYESG